MSLYSKNHTRKEKIEIIVAWAAYLFINLVFCVKYCPAEILKPIYIVLLYPIGVLGAYKISSFKNLRQKNYFFIALSVLMLMLMIFLLNYIDKYSVDVDRWSALEHWSANLKNGEYPYGALTHKGGYASPYPVWQIFHFPFYLLGDVGYGQLFCVTVFLVFLYSIRTKVNAGAYLLLLFMSPCFWWEMAVRSDLLCNMLLLFIFLSVLFYNPVLWEKYKYRIGLLTGLFLCTKMLVAIPLFLYFFPKFISLKLKEKALFILVVLAGLVVPFVPLLFGENSILNHPEYNPILTQTRQGSIWTVIIGGISIVWASLKWKTMKDCYFCCAVFLFLLIFSVGLKILLLNDLHYLIFGDEFDISYFTTSIPFWLFCINELRSSRRVI